MSQATTHTDTRAQAGEAPAIQRQFVSFAFYRLDPAFRRLGRQEQGTAREELLSVMSTGRQGMMCLSYSTVGLKADADFLLWRIGTPAQNPRGFARMTFILPILSA